MSRASEDPKGSVEAYWGLVVDLREAVERGDARAVSALLRAGADPEAVEERGDPTVLMHAAEAGNLDIVRALVEGGANANAEAEDDDLDRFLDEDAAEVVGSSVSPLLYAALRKHRAVYHYLYPRTKPAVRKRVQQVRKALRRLRKASRDRRFKSLLAAVEAGKIDEVRALLDAGVDINAEDKRGGTALLLAAAVDHGEIARLLLDRGADPNIETHEGLAPLHVTTRADIAGWLLDAGAEPNARANFGETPLMSAAGRGPAELVRTLVERGGDLDAADDQGKTVLMYAVEQNNVAALLAAGVDLSPLDERGFSAYRHARGLQESSIADMLRDAGGIPERTQQLFRACAEGQLDEVGRQLAAGADVRDRMEPEPDFELTALHVAARSGHADVVRTLLAAGAEVDSGSFHHVDRSQRELTPLALAAIEGHAEVLRLLIAAGARMHVTSVYHDALSPIMRAAERGHLDAVRILLEAGADPFDTGGPERPRLSALDRAERNGHEAVAEFLRAARP